MKRPPGLWILLSAGVLWLSLQDVYGIRATALIFGKSTTSTTTEAAAGSLPEETNKAETATNSTEAVHNTNKTVTEHSNSTDPVFTGIPQLDYIYDPNLPKELNGYNLSEYPFYERVPEDPPIDFKCDGLHDGFYASVPHKCQVYHHCLFGTRYDFLCANYTAFDQKTFICQFVSEVDCQNSKKFWHRNDALYQAASTTTAAPVNLRAAIYTTAPPNVGDPITPIPRRSTTAEGPRRPVRPLVRRRRPYYEDDYYYDDEYYDERPRPRRKRPRPRPRPVYDYDYDVEEEERYESRRNIGRRRPYRRRNKDRRPPEVEDEEVDDRLQDEDSAEGHRRQKPSEDRRKHQPAEEPEDRDRPAKRPTSTRKTNRRPVQDEYEDEELSQPDDSRAYEQRPRKKPKEPKNNEAVSADGRPIIKPSTGTIYDRPRVAPRINLPVPKNAADKFAYKALGNGKGSTTTSSSTTTAAPLEEEYDDEEYEEPVRKPLPSNMRNFKPRDKPKTEESRTQTSVLKSRTRKPEESEERETKPKYGGGRGRYRPGLKKKPPVVEEYEDEEYVDEEKGIETAKPSLRSEKKSSGTTTTTISPPTTTTTTTTTTEIPVTRKEPVMRIIKRPFLPSRGGNPYNGRGLQPVGLKAVEQPASENESQESRVKEEDSDYIEDTRIVEVPKDASPPKPIFKPSPVVVKVPLRSKYITPSAPGPERIEPDADRPQVYKPKTFPPSHTTARSKVIEKNPLDLNEYDVTLNEALSPTLPNLPVRAFPTGFSSGGEYGYTTYSRPRYVLEPVLSPTNQNFVFPNKRSQQRYEAVPQLQYTTLNREYRHQQPQQQSQTQAILSGY